MMNAGHSQVFRNSITNQSIGIYDEMMKREELFRTKAQVQEAGINKPDKSTWFKRNDDCDAILNVPPTQDQELLGMIKLSLDNGTVGTRVKPIQSFGSTIINQIMTRDIGRSKLCDRPECMICTHPGSKGKCKVENICYQVNCNREPCVSHFDPKNPLNLKDQVDDPPVLYRGESSKTCYIRGSQHLKDYRSQKQGSSLWRHTEETHNGSLGDERGLKDYRMIHLETWPKPLDRLSGEGVLIAELEASQAAGAAKCLNSKQDFRQSHTVTLNFNRGANQWS